MQKEGNLLNQEKYLHVDIKQVKDYWSGKNVPQQWYSDKKTLTLGWFNELRYKRYNLYYEYLKREAEFEYHQKERVLEIGCGIGTDLAEYALNGAIVTGIDLGNDQVQLSQLNFKLRDLQFEKIEVGNAEKLELEAESFDLVFCFGVLHHTPDIKSAIREINRVLKPDGKAIIMLYARGWKHYLKRCLIHGILLGKWPANSFNWKSVYNQISEVNGNSPKTEIFSKREILKLFKDFRLLSLNKHRMGEFFDYPPYNTFVFPKFVKNFCYFVGIERLLGENWIIKLQKSPPEKKISLFEVIFKHY